MTIKSLILVEGENEECFYNEFKECMNHPMDVKKVNVLQEQIPRRISGVKYDNIYFLFDYDVIKNGTKNEIDKYLKNLKENINKMYAQKGKKYLLVQCNNFEDELIYASKGVTNFNQLCRIFGCKTNSKKDFKKNFNTSKNLIIKKKFDIDLEKLYKKFKDNSDSLGDESLDKLSISGSKIFNKSKYIEFRKGKI